MFEFLFSFHGRSGRLSYAFFFLFWIFLFLLAVVGTFFMSLLSPLIATPLMIGLFVAMFISSFAITVRRLHDMDLTGWIALLPITLTVMLFCSAVASVVLGYEIDVESYGEPFMIAYMGVQLFNAVFYWMLLLWPGSKDINRFEA